MAIAVTTSFGYKIDSQFALAHVIARVSGNTAATSTSVLLQLFDERIGLFRCTRGAVLEKGTEATL